MRRVETRPNKTPGRGPRKPVTVREVNGLKNSPGKQHKGRDLTIHVNDNDHGRIYMVRKKEQWNSSYGSYGYRKQGTETF
jgi:hypothetical protein